MGFRVGFGYDIHRLEEGRKLFLGGVEIPYGRGLAGHSDADVLLHAVCDALLGAAALGDIGEFFPDTDPAYEGISSEKLLARALGEVRELGYSVGNLDVVVIAEEPKLGPFKRGIRERLAGILAVGIDRISVKAKTNERLGELGAKQAIACHAVVLLNKG